MNQPVPQSPKSKDSPTLTDEDYYLNEAGLMVFTAAYHLKRGYCCKSACRHCPYGFEKSDAMKK